MIRPSADETTPDPEPLRVSIVTTEGRALCATAVTDPTVSGALSGGGLGAPVVARVGVASADVVDAGDRDEFRTTRPPAAPEITHNAATARARRKRPGRAGGGGGEATGRGASKGLY